MNIFVDNNLSPVIAVTLRGYLEATGIGTACHARENSLGIAHDTSDIDWIRILHEDSSKWVVLSGDQRIRKNSAEIAAWKSTDLVGLLAKKSFTSLKVNIQIAKIITHIDFNILTLKLVPSGTFFELQANGKIKIFS